MKIRWFVIALLVFILILALATGSTIIWRLFMFLGVLLFMSYLWMRINVSYIQGKVVKLTPYGRIGERFEEEFTFYNKGKLPTALIEVREDAEFPGFFPSSSTGVL
jgi:hypothetical protein